MTFKKIVTFTQENDNFDIWTELNKSIAFVQALYCHPMPSEYFDNIDFRFNSDKTYCESQSTHPSQEAYKEWLSVYGEIVEELYLEMQEDFKPLGIKVERFIDNVEISGMFDAQPMENFISKIS